VRDQKRGEVVGDKTFGSGSEQQLFSLSDGGALLLTTAKYAPGAGKAFMDEPINPTVKVERLAEAEVILPDTDEDTDEDKPEPQAQPVPPKPAPPVEDVQLKKAIEIIRQATVNKAATPQKRASLKAPVYYDGFGAARVNT
jgi:carboxyl-terminal processing protease